MRLRAARNRSPSWSDYGTTADAHHVTAGPEDGDGARRAMEIAIAQAGISAREVPSQCARDLQPVGDLGEIEAIRRVFGADFRIAVSGTKSATGHLLGAAGGLGAIFTILALRDQVAPPTLNLGAPDPAGNGIAFVANQARPMEMDYAISNGFGFGGVNASALFQRWTEKLADTNAGGSRD
jgi:3-oxoacyl-[acyl-carrier-protein] synthase II